MPHLAWPTRLVSALVVTALLVTSPVSAQRTAPVDAVRLTSPVTFDGRPDEAAWQGVPPLPLYMLFPTEGGVPSGSTLVRLAYDDTYLWVAAELDYPDAADIRGNSYARDKYSGDDSFDLVVDGYDDNQTAMKFTTNPLGNRNDAFLSGDAATGEWFNRSWDTFWDVRSHVEGAHWTLELRVPFSSLRYRLQPDGAAVVGVSVSYYKAATNERVAFPRLDPAIPSVHLKPSAMQDVRLADAPHDHRPTYLSPYLLAGSEGRAGAGDAGSGALLNVGADLKRLLANDATLDLTLNPDFAQTEADAQQVNLSRFSLFYPEKRRFFLEQVGLFDFDLGDRSSLFYRRRIGLAESGEPVPIYGGARLVGRFGGWDVGALDMQVAPERDLSSANYGVVRLRRPVLNAGSYLGAMGTLQATGLGATRTAYGFDAQFAFPGDVVAGVRWAQSAGVAPDGLPEAETDARSLGDQTRVVLSAERQNERRLHYRAVLARSGRAFAPPIGFVDRTDFSRAAAAVAYGWFPQAGGALSRTVVALDADTYFSNGDGSLETATASPRLDVTWRNGAYLIVRPTVVAERLADTLRFGGTLVPPGAYPFGYLGAEFGSPRTHQVRLEGALSLCRSRGHPDLPFTIEVPHGQNLLLRRLQA